MSAKRERCPVCNGSLPANHGKPWTTHDLKYLAKQARRFRDAGCTADEAIEALAFNFRRTPTAVYLKLTNMELITGGYPEVMS